YGRDADIPEIRISKVESPIRTCATIRMPNPDPMPCPPALWDASMITIRSGCIADVAPGRNALNDQRELTSPAVGHLVGSHPNGGKMSGAGVRGAGWGFRDASQASGSSSGGWIRSLLFAATR